MPAAPRIVSVNLGSQTAGLAEFHSKPHAGLVLNSYRLREVLSDPAAEADRNAHITAELRTAASEMGLKSPVVNYAVSGQSVFARFVKLPAVEQEKIDRIITFEAQQNVPFPIEEVVWDYQLVGGSASEKIEVVLVAIKADLLEGINDAVESAGFQTRLVDVATLSLYNAFRYNYSELTGCSVLVDIGARTTNVLFIEPGKVFSRSVPIGGSSITAAIAKEFGEPFQAAEFRKKQGGFVGLGGTYAEPSDPDVARVSKIVRNTMTRLHAELARSISFYRSQQQGSQPSRVFLCGGTSSTPYMREFFHEKLQLPIEFFNPLRNVTVAGTVAVDEVAKSAHLLGELVGLALRSTTTCPMELNLRPESVVRAHKLTARRPFFLLAGVCLLLALAGWAIFFLRAAHVVGSVTDALQEKVDRMAGVETRIEKLRKESDALDAIATPLLTAIDEHDVWLRILEDLNARLPKEDIWITDLAPTVDGKALGGPAAASGSAPVPAPRTTGKGGAAASLPMIDGLLIHGLYLSNPKQQEVVVDYFRNLVGSPFFVVDANNQSQVIKPSTPNATEWAFPYELRLKLREPIKAP